MGRIVCLAVLWCGWLLSIPAPVYALVFMGEIEPGDVKLGYEWENADRFSVLIRSQQAVGGHFIDAPTWWDGHFSAEYFYQGDEAALQRMVDVFQLVQHPHSKIVVVESEGFWNGNRLLRSKVPLCYDWSLTFSQTTVRDPNRFPNKITGVVNEPIVVLRIYLGDRLDRTKLKLPRKLLENPQIPAAALVIGTDSPADALHAVARAARVSN